MQPRQSFARQAENTGAERAKLFEQRVDRNGKFFVWNNARDEAKPVRLCCADLTAGKNQMRRSLPPDQPRQRHHGHGREAAKLDFRLAESCGFVGQNEIAKGGQFHSAAKAKAVHDRNRQAIGCSQTAKNGVQRGQHFPHALWSVIGNVGARAKSFRASAPENHKIGFG